MLAAPFSRTDPGPLVEQIRAQVDERGAAGCVVAVSGGVDSSVVAALAAKAVGSAGVSGLHLPDIDSDPETRMLAESLAARLGIRLHVEDITTALTVLGCYDGRDLVVRRYAATYRPEDGWTFKIAMKGALTERRFPINYLVVCSPDGVETEFRLRLADYRSLIGLTNLKQRLRMLLTYRLAETENLLVLGTSNKLEVEQGFFVDHGDGTGHLLPLRQLYKSQVFDLALQLHLPEAIISRRPTTDTFSASQDQDEFFFGLPYAQTDEAWRHFKGGSAPSHAAPALGLSAEECEAVFSHFRRREAQAKRLGADVLELGRQGGPA